MVRCGVPLAAAALLAARRIDAGVLVSDVIGLDALPEVFESLRQPNPRAKVLIDPWARAP